MITNINPMFLIDGYKTDHRRQYPKGTEYVYSNLTPRSSRVSGVNSVVFFGLQYFIKEYLIERFNKEFFEKPKEEVVKAYQRRMDNYLGKGAITCEHIAELHDLGYLPIQIKALEEGSLVPIGVSCLTIINTDPKFFWITNYLETLISNIIWKPITSATTAYQYKKRFYQYAEKTGYDKGFINWQGHDFSMRGMSGIEDALLSAAGHLTSFTGTDCVPAIDFLEMYYNADSDKELIGGSVPATEHSVACLSTAVYESMFVIGYSTKEEKQSAGELQHFSLLLGEIYPSGIVSIVSDTWDFWKVMTEYLPKLKELILIRDGKLVIRPDSGDPVKIICGDEDSKIEHERIGAYEILWNIFGGFIDEHGYKHLNSKVGLIYGDSITLERQKEILERLEMKHFSASGLVLGIGSYTYEYVTRDTFGFAMKATWGVVNGVSKNIYKDPKTDSGMKKSAKGLLRVDIENKKYALKECVSVEEENGGHLETVFKDGVLIKEYDLNSIRKKIDRNLEMGY